ncbi:dTMP kinase [Halospina denitrificans]|uniref:Thymidylate kinase n=1 Tax=Halospina denitrificans TaxID=332522 RepID=A0A4R7K227_9GAMM|nr:AAA family ATPase [Halospina denitrificans]TDT44434.1 dTMP kinase [Halospina denitrificans]
MNFSSSNEIGRLIVIEGGDGLGKSTQARALKDRLESEGKIVKEYDFPSKSGTPIGRLIGDFLMGKFGDTSPEFLALAFATDRFSQRKHIKDDLEKGAIVVCDRYVLSNIAFQTAKLDDFERGKELENLLIWLEYGEFALPRPDLEIVLTATDAYYQEGSHLLRTDDPKRDYISGAADIHEGSSSLQLKVNSYFRELPEAVNRKKIAIEDEWGIRKSIDKLHGLIWQVLGELSH